MLSKLLKVTFCTETKEYFTHLFSGVWSVFASFPHIKDFQENNERYSTRRPK